MPRALLVAVQVLLQAVTGFSVSWSKSKWKKPTENPLDGPHGRERERSTFVNKTEFIERVAEEAGFPKSEAQRYFDAVENVVTSALKNGEEVQITGFGKFYVQERTAREGTNPQTGKRMNIPAKRVPSFSAGNTLKESL
jgi:DNA-binding protein HU-beta